MIHQCDFVPAQKVLGARSCAQVSGDGQQRTDEAGITETITAWRCRLCLRLVRSDAVPADGICAAAEAAVMAEAETAFAAMVTDLRAPAAAPPVGALTPQEQADLLRQHAEVARCGG